MVLPDFLLKLTKKRKVPGSQTINLNILFEIRNLSVTAIHIVRIVKWGSYTRGDIPIGCEVLLGQNLFKDTEFQVNLFMPEFILIHILFPDRFFGGCCS